MGIIGSMKKGIEMASKSLLMALAALIVLFVGYMIVGFVLGGTILASKFPPITPDMTPDQISNLNWAQVSWAMLIPGIIVAFILGFLLNSFTQGGIIASLRDCAKEGKEKILAFFGSGLKYCLPLFFQILLAVVVTVLIVIIGIVLMTLVAAIGIVPVVVAIDVVVFLILLALLICIAMTLVYGQISVVLNNMGPVKSLAGAMGFLKKRFLKALGLFVLTAIIYYVVYIAFQLLTGFTIGWPVVSRIIWSLATSYIYIFLSIFMLGSFISFYLASENK